MLWVIRQLLLLRSALSTSETPRQLALGLACGVVLGLVPKGNLLAVALATVLFGTRVSLATGMLAALAVSLVASFLDPFTHTVGHYVLTRSALLPLWRSIYQLPFAAWTSFNNTVVMGSLVVSLATFYPVYRVSLVVFVRHRQRVLAKLPDAESISLEVSPPPRPIQSVPSVEEETGRRCA